MTTKVETYRRTHEASVTARTPTFKEVKFTRKHRVKTYQRIYLSPRDEDLKVAYKMVYKKHGD
jgi:hypothetical protein